MSSLSTIPQIKVGTIKYPVYSVDFTAGIETEPSEIKISFISEDGKYQDPELDLTTPVTIEIGTDIYNYFAVSYEVREAPRGGNILSVTFVDSSFILDQVWVGLYKKHGEESNFPLLIVGSEVDPCAPENLETNPCDPCSKTDSLIECAEQRTDRVLDVRYNFIDLLNEIKAFLPEVVMQNEPTPTSLGESYFARYTGTLREVLKNWTSDYGMTFVWTRNEVTRSPELKFIDLRAGFDINTKNLSTQTEVTQTSRSKSLKDTSCNGVIGHYAQDRQELEFTCGEGFTENVLMNPVTLEDLITAGKSLYYSANNNATNGLENMEIMAILSRYSPALRDLYVTHHVYDLGSYDKLKSRMDSKTKLPLLGNMVIRRVLDQNEGDLESKSLFNLYLETLISRSTVDNKAVNVANSKESASILSKDFSIIIVDMKESLKNKFIEYETGIANDFLGQYYLRRFGAAGKYKNWLSPGGSVQYYPASNDYHLDMPFLKIMDGYLASKGKLDGNPFRRTEDGTADGAVINDDSFLLLQRNAPYSPIANNPAVDAIVESSQDFLFKEINIETFGEIKEIKTSESKAFIVFHDSVSNGSVSFNSSIGLNTIDLNKKGLKYEEGKVSRNWGLRDRRCREILIKVKDKSLKVQGPSQGYSKITTDTVSHGGFEIIGISSGTTLRTVIPKEEVAILNLGEDEANCNSFYKTEITVKEIKEELSAVLDNFCNLSLDNINTLINAYIERLNFNISTPTESKSYTVKGLPDDTFELEDGLKSFSISIGNSGLETSLTFETITKKQLATDLIVKNFENYIEQYTRGNSSFSSLNSQSKFLSQTVTSTEEGGNET